MVLKRIWLVHLMLIFAFVFFLSPNVFAARAADEIEVYKMGNNSITVKWTPYDSGGQPLDKYSIGYRVYGEAAYSYIDVSASLQGADYNVVYNEFTKKISGLTSGTIYDIKIDTYLQGNPVPVVFYQSISAMTKVVIDKTVTTIANPYANDDVGHVDFAFIAPNESAGGLLSSVDESNITGYSLLVSTSDGQIFSNGQPYKVLYNSGTSKYDIFRVTTTDEPLTYTGTQFSFNSQIKDGMDLLAFSLYKTNQPSADNFNLATIHYVVVQPIFKTGTPYENIKVTATAKYETIESIATLLPLTVSQISNDLIRLNFPQVGTGSMSYDIYRGRLVDSLTKIHTEYDDGSRANIQYFNKIDDPLEGDVYYFRVSVSGQSSEITSKVIPIAISLNPNIAPIMENIQVEKIITDTVNKSADIIISWDKPVNEDAHKDDLIYRVYINTDRQDQVFDNDVIYDGTGNILLDGDGKIMLNTKRDINNNNILYKGYPVVFERISEVVAVNLIGSGAVYVGNDPLNNYLSTGNNYYRIIRDETEVIRIIYRINGDDFISNPDAPTSSGEPHTIYNSILEGELATDYKNKFELNTSYFLKMDSYNILTGESSDYSLTTSFTTPGDVIDTVPVPENFEVDLIDTQSIGLVWDKISNQFDDSDVTYEVFMSENSSYSDIDFHRVDIPAITVVDGREYLLIDTTYTLDDGIPKLVEPNKVYLFRVRARWDTVDEKGNAVSIYSDLSSILPVTTKRTLLPDPDVNAPPAPVDFCLTNVTSTTASFQWTSVDETSTYRIVKTSEPIEPFAPLSVTGDGVTNGFALNGETYTYSDAALSANTLYCFSVRAETTFEGETLFSTWITVPVTTILVEAPTELTLVSRNSDGHSITISWKGKASLNYEVVKRDDSVTSYQVAGTATGDTSDPGTKVFQLTVYDLKSNVQYLIKVRAKDPSTSMYSKYTDPIQVRTQFNQTDYDNEIKNKEKIELITDIGESWLKSPSDRIGSDVSKLELWIKEHKVSSAVKNSSNPQYSIELNDSVGTKNKSVYIPLGVVEALEEKKSNLEVKTQEGKYYFKPAVLDADMLEELINDSSVKGRIIKMQINELNAGESSAVVPNVDFQASKVSDISLKLVGYNKTVEELNALIASKINSIITEEKSFASYKTIDQLKEEFDSKIKSEIKTIINDAYISETPIGINNKIRIVHSFNTDPNGKSSVYVAYIKNNQTSQEIQGQVIGNNKLQFETSILGKVVIIGKNGPKDINGNWAEENIKKLILNYDFSKEIVNGRFRPNDFAKREETLSFIINILSPQSKEFEGLSVADKAQKLGITSGFPTWDLKTPVTREELAYLLAKVYEIKTGIDCDNGIYDNIAVNDESSITEKYKNSVYQMIQSNIMSNLPENLFYPTKKATRAEVITALVNILKSVGEIE